MFETDIGEQQEHTGSFMYLSIPLLAAREFLLSLRSRRWLSVPAIVESTHRSRGGYRETIRGELWYSYSLNGEQHSGRIVRDCGFSFRKINALVGHDRGQTIHVRVNQLDPSQSYYPSGLGYIEPVIIGAICGGGTLLLVSMMISTVLSSSGR